MMTRTVTTLPVTEKTVGPQYDPNTKLGNWDTARQTITRIIIHTMVGYAEAADERFNDPTSNVSAHYGVREDGIICHWVDEDKVAYHAGDYAVNQQSIGIEFEDNGQPNSPRTDALYTSGAKLIREISQFYNIPLDRDHIKKHLEVSDSPTSCPDSLDIDRLVNEAINPTPDTQTLLNQCVNDRNKWWNALIALYTPFNMSPDPMNIQTQITQIVAMIKMLQTQAAEPKQTVVQQPEVQPQAFSLTQFLQTMLDVIKQRGG